MRVRPVRPVTVTIGQSHIEAWPLNPGPDTSIRSVGSGAMVVVVLHFALITQVGSAYEVPGMVKPPVSYTSGTTKCGNGGDVVKGAPEVVVPLTVTRPDALRVPGHYWGKVAARIPPQD